MDLTCAPDRILDELTTIDAVRALETIILQVPQVDLDTHHIVFGKVSARAIYIPEGVVLTGALTNCDNVCIVLGDISVTTDEGVKRLTGFNMIRARAGAKRAGIAHAGTWWITVHHTELTDVRDVEDEMTNESEGLQTRRAFNAIGSAV